MLSNFPVFIYLFKNLLKPNCHLVSAESSLLRTMIIERVEPLRGTSRTNYCPRAHLKQGNKLSSRKGSDQPHQGLITTEPNA